MNGAAWTGFGNRRSRRNRLPKTAGGMAPFSGTPGARHLPGGKGDRRCRGRGSGEAGGGGYRGQRCFGGGD